MAALLPSWIGDRYETACDPCRNWVQSRAHAIDVADVLLDRRRP